MIGLFLCQRCFAAGVNVLPFTNEKEQIGLHLPTVGRSSDLDLYLLRPSK